ncbi:hypothetical protein [Pseudorhizobium endolithicum]|uniref:hypothetical protein n=1 Tax=Pseudorhizobium endolithicum TaxID=1191678 RepID=UPI00163BA432|nr:hypothetical protein [Pseudorhizobium endolithicum]
MERPEDEARAIDKEEVIAFFHGYGIAWGTCPVHEKFRGVAAPEDITRTLPICNMSSLEKPDSASHLSVTGA